MLLRWVEFGVECMNLRVFAVDQHLASALVAHAPDSIKECPTAGVESLPDVVPDETVCHREHRRGPQPLRVLITRDLFEAKCEKAKQVQ